MDIREFSDGNYSSNERGLQINNPSSARSSETVYNEDNEDENSAFPFYEAEEDNQDILSEEHIPFHNKKEQRIIYMELVTEQFSVLRLLLSTFYVFYPYSPSSINRNGTQEPNPSTFKGNIKSFLEAVCFSHPLTLSLEDNQLILSSRVKQRDIGNESVTKIGNYSRSLTSSLTELRRDEITFLSSNQHNVQLSSYNYYRTQLLLLLTVIYLFLFVCLFYGLISCSVLYFYPTSSSASVSSTSPFEQVFVTATDQPAVEQRHLLALLDLTKSMISSSS
jgi:hypothetical protein